MIHGSVLSTNPLVTVKLATYSLTLQTAWKTVSVELTSQVRGGYVFFPSTVAVSVNLHRTSVSYST